MPAPFSLTRVTLGDEVVIAWGGRALFVYDSADRALRNLAIVALSDAGVRGVELAELFGIRPEWVSRLRREAREHSSAGLLPPMGRPRKLDAEGVAKVYRLADEDASGVQIAKQIGVSEATISRVLSRRPRPKPETLGFEDDSDDDDNDGDVAGGDEGSDGEDFDITDLEDRCWGDGWAAGPFVRASSTLNSNNVAPDTQWARGPRSIPRYRRSSVIGHRDCGSAPGTGQPELASRRRSHRTRAPLASCDSTAPGAKPSKVWKPPGHTCSSARPPACHSREA